MKLLDIVGDRTIATKKRFFFLNAEISNFAENLENQRELIAKKAVEFYEGPLANRTALIVENIENGSAIVADNFSSFLFWLGHTLISIGYQTKKFVHFTFRSIGEFLGDTIEQGETFLGTQLIKTGENIHIASIDLERNSHDDGENLRKKLIEKTPQIENSIRRIIDRIAHRIHQIGEQTEMNGNELVNRHRFIENLQQIR